MRITPPQRSRTLACSSLLLLLFGTIADAGGAKPGWSKALLWPAHLGDRVATDTVLNVGAEPLREYESFTLVRIPTGKAAVAIAEASKASYRLEVEEDWDKLLMPGAVVDTRAPVLPAQGLIDRYPQAVGLYVVQFDGPITPGMEKELGDHNLTFVGYVPYHGVVVFGAHHDVVRLSVAPEVQWTSIYHPAFRAQPTKLPPPDEPIPFLVQLVDVPGSEATWAWLRAANLGPEETTTTYLSYRNVTIRASSALIPDLLADPYVVGIELPGVAALSGEREAIGATSLTVSSTEPYQDGVRPYKPAGNYRTWLTNRGVLDTSAYRIAFADTGLAGYHQDITPGRDIGYQSYIPGDPDVYDHHGHGTAVIGFAVGDSVAGSTDSGGFFYGMGLAPKTKVFSQRILDGGGALRYDNEMTLANDAYNWGCTVQTHSWNDYNANPPTDGDYTTKAQEFDTAVRDTYGGGGVTPMPVTAAAGNIGNCINDWTTKVLPPATAKNVLSVGASESWRDWLGNCACVPGNNPRVESYKNVAWFSRRGTDDGRIKPDIIAPGDLASSTRLAGAYSCYTAPAEYMINSGTSYAAPQAAASYVLLRKKRGVTLSPAMLKAAIIGNSLSVKGGIDRYTGQTVAARPNPVQGFGRLYLGDALATSGVTQTYLDEGSWTPFTGAGQTRSRSFTVANISKPTVLVVAWTDQPGMFHSPRSLNRDIDIWFQWPLSPTWFYTGNRLTTSEVSQQQTTPTWDNLNNVEMIVIPANTIGQFTINLTLREWSPGWPNQAFAVFASNAY